MIGPLSSARSSAKSLATVGSVVARSRVIRPYSPVTLARLALTLRSWGTGLAGGFASLAVRDPSGLGVIDELGALTWGEIDRRSNALARALAERGVVAGDAVAVMCRNHRGFVDASVAIAKLGADVLLLNTAFAGPQLAEVIGREKPRVVIHDEEFTGLLSTAPIEQRVLAWTDTEAAALAGQGRDVIEVLIANTDDRALTAPERHGRIVILTSGTTGTPKGAPRSEAGIDAAVSLLSRLPLRAGWRVHIAAPLFHTWGVAHLMLSMLLGSTVVLRRSFDPEAALAATAGERCEALVVIPVMMQRMLALPDEVRSQYDVSGLEIVASSGSALPGDLAIAWMDAFGDNLYNTYGSTEVAYASIAMPADLRVAPTSAGKPPWKTTVRILDPAGVEVAAGESGRIFVGNGMLFEGYTGGGGKEVIDGLMSTGDVGRFGPDGRLYVEGRDDEMIISGGENVFPKEVEDCLVRHEAVVEAAAIGVADEGFGQRLRAFVVLSAPVSEQELQEWVRTHLARFKVPREVIVLDVLPRNATGKVLKRELAEWSAEA